MAYPTMTTHVPRAVLIGNGSRGPFTLNDSNGNPIRIRTQSHLVVRRYSSVADETGTALALNTDYTVNNINVDAVTITLTVAQAVVAPTERLVVMRLQSLADVISLSSGGNFSAEALSAAMSVLTEELQETRRDVDRSIKPSWRNTVTPRLPIAPAETKVLGHTSDDRLVHVERETPSLYTVQETYIASGGQLVFFLQQQYEPNRNNIEVFVDGIRLLSNEDYIESTSSAVTFIVPRTAGQEVVFLIGRRLGTSDPGPPIGGLVYVRTNGDDFNSGRTLSTAVKTIARGLQVANALGSGYVVSVYPGTYTEDGELVIGAGNGVVSVGGQYITNVFASTGNESKNMFLLNSGSYLQGFAFRNMSVDSFDNPTGGFAAAFAPGATIFRSPYVRDISQVSQYLDKQIVEPLGPELSPPNPILSRGGGTILADRAVLNQNSVFPYILAFGATPRSPNGIGYCAKNGAGINGISSVTIFQRIAFYALNGGQITLNNSGTQFGDISFRSRGSMPVQVPAATSAGNLAVSTTGAAAIATNKQAVIDAMWQVLVTAGYTVGQPASYETFTRRDAGNLLDSLRFDFLDGDQKVTQAYALGFFDYKGDLVFTYSTPHVPSGTTLGFQFKAAWDAIKIALYAYAPFDVVGAPRTMLDALIGIVKDTVDPATRPAAKTFSSLIESLAHQFNNAGAGVNANALPLNFRRPGTNQPVPYTIIAEAGTGINNGVGRVRWSGADELNNQYFAGGTKINGLTGRIEGRSFNNAVRQIARRISNSQGVY